MQDTYNETEKTETENPNIEEIEKNKELIKETFSETIKRLKSILHISEKDRKKKQGDDQNILLGQLMIEKSENFNPKNPLCYGLKETGGTVIKLQKELIEMESRLEKEVLPSFEKIISDIEEIDKLKKIATKSKSELDNWKSKNLITQKYNLSKEKLQNMENELNTLNKTFENAEDLFLIEIFKFISKEKSYSWLYVKMLEIEIEYHKTSVATIFEVLPGIHKNIDYFTPNPLFGISFEKHFELFGAEVSIVLKNCADAIIMNGLDREGIFRLAGSNSKIKKIKASFDSGIMNLLEKNFDVYSLAVVMKQYLRELPEPILTFELEDEWIDVSNHEQSIQLDAINKLVKKLPHLNYENLKFLIGFLVKVAENSEINKMTPSNLAISIGPNMLWSKDDLKYMKCTGAACMALNIMITNFNEVFEIPRQTRVDKNPKLGGKKIKSFEHFTPKPAFHKKNKTEDLSSLLNKHPIPPLKAKNIDIFRK